MGNLRKKTVLFLKKPYHVSHCKGAPILDLHNGFPVFGKLQIHGGWQELFFPKKISCHTEPEKNRSSKPRTLTKFKYYPPLAVSLKLTRLSHSITMHTGTHKAERLLSELWQMLSNVYSVSHLGLRHFAIGLQF